MGTRYSDKKIGNTDQLRYLLQTTCVYPEDAFEEVLDKDAVPKRAQIVYSSGPPSPSVLKSAPIQNLASGQGSFPPAQNQNPVTVSA